MKGFAKFLLTATAATEGYSLAVNSEPRTGTRVSWPRPGERIAIECQVQGDWVDGRWGCTNLWDRIPGRGYVSDGWVDTGTNGPLKGVPTSTDAPSQPTRAPQPTTPPQPQQDYQYPFTGQFFLPFANGASYPITQGSFSSCSVRTEQLVICCPVTSSPSSSRPQKLVRSGAVKVALDTSRSFSWVA